MLDMAAAPENALEGVRLNAALWSEVKYIYRNPIIIYIFAPGAWTAQQISKSVFDWMA